MAKRKAQLSLINDIIETVNQLAANPPDGCISVAPLELLSGKLRMKASQIFAIRSKLQEICPENTFRQFAHPQKIDGWQFRELFDAISRGWCNCDQCPTKPATDENGKEVVIYQPAYTVYPNYDEPGPPYPFGKWFVAANIEGHALAIPGYKFRDWIFTAWNGTIPRYQRFGQVRIDGTVDASTIPNTDVLEEHVFSVVAGHCVFADPDTGGPTAECAADLELVRSRVQRYTLQLSSVLAECADNPS